MNEPLFLFAMGRPNPAGGTTLYVIDCDVPGRMSVTNAPQIVLEVLKQTLGVTAQDRVLYRDTMGRWDEIRHLDGRFTDFTPGRPHIVPEDLNWHSSLEVEL